MPTEIVDVCCILDDELDLYHASSLVTGLCWLAGAGAIGVEFVRHPDDADREGADHHVLRLRAEYGDKRKADRIALELSDSSRRFAMNSLAWCDVYFKRSFHEPDLSAIQDERLRGKIQPLGLNYAARSAVATRKMLPDLASRVARSLFRPKERASTISMLAQFWRAPKPEEFEISPAVPLESGIIFQTRVWEPSLVKGENIEAINQGRVGLVKALRKEFGERFHGGLYPSAYARANFPDAISAMPARHKNYIAWSKRHLIGVNTRGLHESVAFKFPEYLAGSKCIVSEPIRNANPEPLIEGKHYLAFQANDECVAACAMALESPNLAKELREQAWRYYQKEVEPAAHVLNCLQRASESLRSRPSVSSSPGNLNSRA
jgi:hypothetical protein